MKKKITLIAVVTLISASLFEQNVTQNGDGSISIEIKGKAIHKQ